MWRRLEAEVAAGRQELNRALAEEQVAWGLNSGWLGRFHVGVVGCPRATFRVTRALREDVQWSLQERPDLVVARALIDPRRPGGPVRAHYNVMTALRDSGVAEAEFLSSTGRFP